MDAAAPLAGAAHPAQPPLCRRVRLWPPPRAPRPQTARRPSRECRATSGPRCIPDAHPGYITWEHYETNQKLLLANAPAHGAERAAGPAREGTALLQGLAICGALRTADDRPLPHPPRRRSPRLPVHARLHRRRRAAAARPIPGAGVDAAIGQLLLDTLTPLALEVALTVQAELEARADEADALRRSHVERARHRADLARRRYLAVDPDNRLVADTLEADWNDALRAPARRPRRLRARQPPPPSRAQRRARKARIRALAADFPALWSDPATPQRERKRMARLLIEDVTMAKTDQHPPPHPLPGRPDHQPRPSRSRPPAWQARQTHPDTLAELDRLLDDHTDAEAADALNAAGHRSGEGKPFTGRIVLHLRRSNHLPSHADRLRARGLLTITETRRTARRAPLHHQGLAPRRPAHLPQGQRQEHAALRTAHPGDPRLVKRQGSQLSQTSSHPTTPGGAV